MTVASAAAREAAVPTVLSRTEQLSVGGQVRVEVRVRDEKRIRVRVRVRVKVTVTVSHN